MNQKIHLLIVALITVMLFSIPVFSSCESDNLQGIGVDVVAPTHVVSGEEFVFEVRVENTEEKPRLLYSVDIWDAYLEGIFILRASRMACLSLCWTMTSRKGEVCFISSRVIFAIFTFILSMDSAAIPAPDWVRISTQ